jgi:hypothetical protein
MKKTSLMLLFILCYQVNTFGQHGTAGNGYYPSDYHGDTFTGEVTAVDDSTREVTMKYVDTKRGKEETFVGFINEGYTLSFKDGTTRELKPSNLRVGGRFKVYYTTKTSQVEGRKVKVNTIILIEGFPDATRRYWFFKAF